MQDKDLIKSAVVEALEEKLGDFFIEREKHFQHHQFIDGVMSFSENIKSTACKTVTTIVIIGAVTILILGLVAWIKKNIFGGANG